MTNDLSDIREQDTSNAGSEEKSSETDAFVEFELPQEHDLQRPAQPIDMPTHHEPLWQKFDPEWYQARYPEVAKLMQSGFLTDVETFYFEQGIGLRHSPNRYFDEAWYLETYPDIAAHVAAGGARSGFDHYCRDGFRGRSPHWLFDENYYLSNNLDVTRGLLDRHGLLNGYDHFLTVGAADLRNGHRFFDANLFLQNHVDAGDLERRAQSPFARFLDDNRIGSTTRLSWYFDPVWYLQTYPEIAEDIDAGLWSCALHHFLCNRTPRQFQALREFSEDYYAELYPDIAGAVVKGVFRNGYEHFVVHGAAERRKPHPDIDLNSYYLQSVRVQNEIGRGDFRDTFQHWLARYADLGSETPAIDEMQCKQLTMRIAESMLAQFAHAPLDFSLRGEPAVSVIMVLHNQFAFTMAALASLRAVYRGDIELILADSGSRDETKRIGRYVTGARIIRFEKNAGFLESCNTALRHATGRAVLYMNNDMTLGYNAIELALKRLFSDEQIGAVGAKIIRTNGALQEAGSIIWRDGSTCGYLRDGHPDLPEANFVRDVDFCSGAFLLVKSTVLKELGGFDDDYRPAYYEETDLCVRMRKQGYRIVYDPAVVIQHVEYGSANSSKSERMIQRNHGVFVRKHLDWLRFQYPPRPRNALFARSRRVGPGRILFIEDRIPQRDLGSGYVRSNDIIHAMAALGYEVSVFPIYPTNASLLEVLGDFPETAEILYDRGMEQLPYFIDERAGFYDIVWIGRTHNLERLLPILNDASQSLPNNCVVLDTEAVAAARIIERARALGLPQTESLDELLQQELSCAYFCQRIIAVNDRDADLIRRAGHSNVSVLGHVKTLKATPRHWIDRSGILFVGAIHETSSPNYDSLNWFVTKVLPLLKDQLPPDVRFTIAGYIGRDVDMSPFGQDPRVDLLGAVEDLEPLYNSHRVFAAPTRFAGGIPFKIHEAAAHGLPIVATDLLCDQVGWNDRVELLRGGTDDPARFAERLVWLHTNPELWGLVRHGALERIRTEHSPEDYQSRLKAILTDVIDDNRPSAG